MFAKDNTGYYIECDCCKKRATDESYGTVSEAAFHMMTQAKPGNKWLTVCAHVTYRDKHYCPECYHTGLIEAEPYRNIGYNRIVPL